MMSLVLITGLIALTLFPCYLLRQINLSKKVLLQSEETRIQLAQFLECPEAENPPAPAYMRVIIEINDPLELAKREQPLTKYLSQLAPELIVKKVYEQVASEVESGLTEKGVNASVSIEKR